MATTVSDWASARGFWRYEFNPAQREILDTAGREDVSRIVIRAQPQAGLTEIMCILARWFAEREAEPVLLVQPTTANAKWLRKNRLRGDRNPLLLLAGANSPSEIAQRPVATALLDTIERFPWGADDDGLDVIDLAISRTATFSRSLIVLGGVSGLRLDTEFCRSDRRFWNGRAWTASAPFSGIAGFDLPREHA